MNFLFLVIQMMGVTTMASCQEMLGICKSKSSIKVPMKLIRNTIKLKTQNPIKPVVRETNSFEKVWDSVFKVTFNLKFTKC